jgi:hypothetical protein
MTLAYLIMAYKNPAQIRRLLGAIAIKIKLSH